MNDDCGRLWQIWLPGIPAFAAADDAFAAVGILVRDEFFAVGDPDAVFWREFFRPERLKVLHHAKNWLRQVETPVDSGRGFFDVMLAVYLYNPAADCKTLAGCARTALQRELAADDLAESCRALRELYRVLEPRYGGNALFRDIEMPLAGVLARMECRGMRVDVDGLRRYGAALGARLAELERAIYDVAGETVNLNSPKQLGALLFEKLGIAPGRKTKSGYSTDADVLKKLRDAHPVIPLLLEYRQLSKLSSTYVDGLLKAVHPDGKIHTSFNMTATATGRLSSADPNLQNIPIRSELGGELRRMLTADPGEVLVDADYAQIELRLLAHIADDPAMIAAFRNHEDIHTATASRVFNVPFDAVTPELRRRAKAVNFGIIYGISAFALADDLGISRDEAQHYIDHYFEEYGHIRAYLDRIVRDARKNGYVETLFGRRRWLPELKSPIFAVRSFGERAALNAPMQGTAADLIKLAMVRTARNLAAAKMRTELVLQIHDELILAAPQDEAAAATRILKEAMENVIELKVPLEVSLSTGANYLELK